MTQLFCVWAGKSAWCPIRAFEQILFNESDKRFTNPFESFHIIWSYWSESIGRSTEVMTLSVMSKSKRVNEWIDPISTRGFNEDLSKITRVEKMYKKLIYYIVVVIVTCPDCFFCDWSSSNLTVLKAAVSNFFCVYNLQKCYNKWVRHESIFQTMLLAYPESLRYTYNKCLYSDYFKLVLLRSNPVPAWLIIDKNREK